MARWTVAREDAEEESSSEEEEDMSEEEQSVAGVEEEAEEDEGGEAEGGEAAAAVAAATLSPGTGTIAQRKLSIKLGAEMCHVSGRPGTWWMAGPSCRPQGRCCCRPPATNLSLAPISP